MSVRFLRACKIQRSYYEKSRVSRVYEYRRRIMLYIKNINTNALDHERGKEIFIYYTL